MRGANTEAKTSTGHTSIMLASKSNRIGVVRVRFPSYISNI